MAEHPSIDPFCDLANTEIEKYFNLSISYLEVTHKPNPHRYVVFPKL